MSDLLALAERVERAEGPSRNLDAEIASAVGWDLNPLAYTALLDAAMMLVPSKCFPGVSNNVHHGDWHAWMGVLRDGEPDTIGEANAWSPALALTTAALRARAEVQGSDSQTKRLGEVPG